MAPLVTAFNMPPLYVVAMHPPAFVDAPVQFLNWAQKPGPRVAAYVTGELDTAVSWAATAFTGPHNPDATTVCQLTDNTAGVMGELLEVVRISREVTPG